MQLMISSVDVAASNIGYNFGRAFRPASAPSSTMPRPRVFHQALPQERRLNAGLGFHCKSSAACRLSHATRTSPRTACCADRAQRRDLGAIRPGTGRAPA